jgi:hypothetical protein
MGAGTVTGEHIRSVRDSRPHIGARELVPLTALVLVLIGLLWLRTAKLVPSDPAYGLPRDHHMYAFMATHPVGSLHVAPWGWRLFGPAFAPLVPGSVTVGFQVLAVGALSLTALAMFLIVRRLGFDRRLAIIGVVLFLSLGYAVKFNLYDFWLTDPLAFFFTAAVLLCVVLRLDIGFAICLAIGVLAKESVFFVVGLHYGLRARRPVDPQAALNTLLLALPAIAVLIGVRATIPSWNERPSYLASLPLPIRRNARTVPSYDAIDVLRATVERQDWPGAAFDALTTFGVTVSLLVVLGARAARGLAVRFAPFLVLVLSQLLFALNTQRLVALAFPAVIVLALAGLRKLRDDLHVDEGILFALALGTFGLGLIQPTEWMPNVVAQMALAAAVVAAALVRRRMHVPATP